MELARASIVPLRKNEAMDFHCTFMSPRWPDCGSRSTWFVDFDRVVVGVADRDRFAVVALVFTAVNSIIKPVVTTLAFPLYLLTFGLFALVTNSLLFALTGWLSTSLGFTMTTGGFLSCLAGAVITSVVSSIVSGILRDRKDERD